MLAAWLAGPTKFATSIRSAIAPWFRQPQYAYGSLVVLLVLLFWWDPTVGTHRLVPSLLLILLLALGFESLRRQVTREFGDRVATADAPAPAAESDPRLAELERLTQLRASNTLSEEEFAAEKTRILGS